MLQTEPQAQEVLRIEEMDHDNFLHCTTDARPDTGGLSGATPSEAVSWGKVDPNQLPDAIVANLDLAVALPVLMHYAFGRRPPRRRKRLYDKCGKLLARLPAEYFKHDKDATPVEW